MAFIRAPEDAPDIVAAIKHLYLNRLHTDIDLVSRDGMEKYPVHKLIVAMNSPVLAKVLYPKASNFIATHFLQVSDHSNLALQNLIRYFYDEDLVLENITDIRQTKAIAEKYEVHKLSNICRYELLNVPISTTDVLSILETAKEFQNEEKENECIRLISENQDEIFNSREFLGLAFRRVLDIFDKIKKMDMMTDAEFLRFAIRWLDTNGSIKETSKKLLLEKIDVTSLQLLDYLDIMQEYATFFSGVEISFICAEIRSRCVVQNAPSVVDIKTEKKECCNAETNTDFSDREEQLLGDVNFFKNELLTEIQKREEVQKTYDSLVLQYETKNLESEQQNEQIKELERTVKKLRERSDISSPMSSLTYASLDSKQKHLSIQILNPDDGVNVYELEKRARISIQEGCTIRSIQVAVDAILKKGLIGTVADKKGNYSESDVDISYEGIYFMLRSFKDLDETLSPNQYIEVLKAALYFQLKDVAEKCIKRISGIVDYDPVFLDGLRATSYLKDKSLGLKGISEFKDKYMTLLLSEPLRVILHPNFTKCSVDLIVLLLQQSELKVKDESQLLLVIIAWLEAEKENRRLFRMTLLKSVAFQNLSTADFRYVVMHYPNFFEEKEQKLILAYRNAVGTEVKFFRENLPEWYSTKTRKHI